MTLDDLLRRTRSTDMAGTPGPAGAADTAAMHGPYARPGAPGAPGEATATADMTTGEATAAVPSISDLFATTPTLNGECPITAEQARRLACDARIIPAVLGPSGEILDLGRETRTATRALT